MSIVESQYVECSDCPMKMMLNGIESRMNQHQPAMGAQSTTLLVPICTHTVYLVFFCPIDASSFHLSKVFTFVGCWFMHNFR